MSAGHEWQVSENAVEASQEATRLRRSKKTHRCKVRLLSALQTRLQFDTMMMAEHRLASSRR